VIKNKKDVENTTVRKKTTPTYIYEKALGGDANTAHWL